MPATNSWELYYRSSWALEHDGGRLCSFPAPKTEVAHTKPERHFSAPPRCRSTPQFPSRPSETPKVALHENPACTRDTSNTASRSSLVEHGKGHLSSRVIPMQRCETENVLPNTYPGAQRYFHHNERRHVTPQRLHVHEDLANRKHSNFTATTQSPVLKAARAPFARLDDAFWEAIHPVQNDTEAGAAARRRSMSPARKNYLKNMCHAEHDQWAAVKKQGVLSDPQLARQMKTLKLSTPRSVKQSTLQSCNSDTQLGVEEHHYNPASNAATESISGCSVPASGWLWPKDKKVCLGFQSPFQSTPTFDVHKQNLVAGGVLGIAHSAVRSQSSTCMTPHKNEDARAEPDSEPPPAGTYFETGPGAARLASQGKCAPERTQPVALLRQFRSVDQSYLSPRPARGSELSKTPRNTSRERARATFAERCQPRWRV